MTNTANYPATKEQFTANANALKSLVNGKTRGTDNIRVASARFNAAQSAIARMQTWHDINPTSPVAPRIAQRIIEMKAELAAAVALTPPTVSSNLLDPIATPTESGQAAILMLIALVAIIICLYFATSAAAKAAGYTDIVAMMDAMTHIFPTP